MKHDISFFITITREGGSYGWIIVMLDDKWVSTNPGNVLSKRQDLILA